MMMMIMMMIMMMMVMIIIIIIIKVGLTVFVLTLSLGANAGASMNPAVTKKQNNFHICSNFTIFFYQFSLLFSSILIIIFNSWSQWTLLRQNCCQIESTKIKIELEHQVDFMPRAIAALWKMSKSPFTGTGASAVENSNLWYFYHFKPPFWSSVKQASISCLVIWLVLVTFGWCPF